MVIKNNMKVAKLFEISVGHRLSNYEGKCKHWHGHNYIGELIFESEFLNQQGMLIDFGQMKRIIKTLIDKKFDHKFLLKRYDAFNEAMIKTAKKYEDKKDSSFVIVDYNPTVENIIKDIQKTIERVYPDFKIKIKLSETSTSYAEIE